MDRQNKARANEKAKAKAERTPLMKRFAPYMGRKKGLLGLSLLLSGISAALHVLPFVLIWMTVRALLAGAALDLQALTRMAWQVLALELLAVLFYFVALICSHLAAFRVEVAMQKIGMRRVMHLPLGFFDRNASGRMRKILIDGAGTTHSFLAHQLPDLSASVVAPLALFALVLAVDLWMGLALLLPILVGFGLMGVLMKGRGRDFQRRYTAALEEMSAESVEYVRGIPVVKTFGQSLYAFKRFYNSIMHYREMVFAYTITWKRPMGLYTVLMNTGVFLLIPVAILQLNAGGDLGTVLGNFLFYFLVAPIFTLLVMKSMYLSQNRMFAERALDRVDALLDYPEMRCGDGDARIADHTLEFRQVSFTYPGTEKKALDGVSFTLRPGETLALVGASGGGKSSVARLAARFFDPDEGSVSLGGVDLRELSKQGLMERIAFVFQSTQLFKMSLRDNIRYGNPGASEAEIARAVELSQSREIIDALPQGLDTMIGSKGTYLSGGEQQRIALARAIVKDAPIVLLDEATAFADPENEHLIRRALRALCRDKTTLMIAHRLSSVVDADCILVMEGGRVVERGTHEALLARGGRYSALWDEYRKAAQWKLQKEA